jgi:hypothetical protein
LEDQHDQRNGRNIHADIKKRERPGSWCKLAWRGKKFMAGNVDDSQVETWPRAAKPLWSKGHARNPRGVAFQSPIRVTRLDNFPAVDETESPLPESGFPFTPGYPAPMRLTLDRTEAGPVFSEPGMGILRLHGVHERGDDSDSFGR